MLGICFESVEKVAVCEIPDPVILDDRDVIVDVTMAGLCGSDLHPFFGRESGLDAGTVMGHELVGFVSQAGSAIKNLKEGDRVCAPFTTNCGDCFYCRSGLTSRCVAGELFGWRSNGEGLHGCQSQRVRVPLGDSTLAKVPDGMSNETALLLGDNLSTGYFAAEMAAINPAGTYVVIGCGTVGLLAIQWAVRMGAESIVAVDLVESRLAIARDLGAKTFSDPAVAIACVMDKTDGRGADAVMELVGLPSAQELAFQIVRPGGILSVIGCHCTPNFTFSPNDAYDKNLTYRTGRCPARHYMSALANELQSDPPDTTWCISHRFQIEQGVNAYDVFANRKDGCVKAVVEF